MTQNYNQVREKVHSGECLIYDGKRYEDCTDEEKEAFDTRIDELKTKQEKGQEEDEQKDQNLDKFKEYAHEKIKTGSEKSYDELTDREKEAFDQSIEEYYYKRKNEDSDNDEGTDSEPNTDRSHEMSHSRRGQDDDDSHEYSR